MLQCKGVLAMFLLSNGFLQGIENESVNNEHVQVYPIKYMQMHNIFGRVMRFGSLKS